MWTATLSSALLQNTAAGLALAVVAVALHRWGRRPGLAHACWILVLVKLVLPPLVTVRIPARWVGQGVARPTEPVDVRLAAAAQDVVELTSLQPDREAASLPPSSDVPAPVAMPPRQPTAVHWLDAVPWDRAAMGVWIAGSVVCAAVVLGRVRRFNRVLRLAMPVDEDVAVKVAQLAHRLGVRAPAALFVPGALSPMVFAFFGRARLLIPVDLWHRLNEAQQSSLIAHELAHLHRGDHWVRWLEVLVTALLWWHPLVWIARRGLRDAEEECCDAWVAWALPDCGRQYAAALLDTLDFISERTAQRPRRPLRPPTPAWASGMGDFRRLKRRLLMITATTATATAETGAGAGSQNARCPMARRRLAFIVLIGAAALTLKPAAVAQTTPGLDPPAASGLPGGSGGPAEVAAEPLRATSSDTVITEMRQAQAEVEKLRAALAAADARLKALEAKHANQASRSTAGTGAAMGGGGAMPRAMVRTDTPPMTNGGYRVLQADGTILEYSSDGKIVTMWAPGTRPPITPTPVPTPKIASDPRAMTATPPLATPSPDMAKKLDRLEAQMRELSDELAKLRNEVSDGNKKTR